MLSVINSVNVHALISAAYRASDSSLFSLRTFHNLPALYRSYSNSDTAQCTLNEFFILLYHPEQRKLMWILYFSELCEIVLNIY